MMKSEYQAAKAESWLKVLCEVKPNRRTGSAGNREATTFVADRLRSFGYTVDDTPFDCLDYTTGEVRLAHADDSFEVYIGP